MSADSTPERPQELVVLSTGDSLGKLGRGLTEQGVTLHMARDLTELRDLFFGCGGSDGLLLAPDLAPARAREAMRLLQQIDRELCILAFGEPLTRQLAPSATVHRIPYHPDSRAAEGAVLRWLLAGTGR